MNKLLLSMLLVILLAVLHFGCQDKYLMATVQPARGSLKSDGNDSCLPKTIAGTYKVGKGMNDSNFLQVAVNVTFAGTYTIQTDTVNGISFKATGSFQTTGLNTVKLVATGTPISESVKLWTVKFDGSLCVIPIAVGPVVPSAGYTLQGSPTACMLDTVFGIYAVGATPDTANRIVVTVNVSSVGLYSISTDTVNGYSFGASGTFGSTGIQTVTLNVAGAPLVAGTNNFTVKGFATTCTIPITVVTPVAVPNSDYFPLSMNSYWNYDDFDRGTADTMQRVITNQTTQDGATFQLMEERTPWGTNQLNFRKYNGAYYEYGKVDKYTLSSLSYTPSVYGQILFLKQNLSSGDTWMSDEFSGAIPGGQKIYLRYVYSCVNSNAVVTVNGKTFINVYKINMYPEVRSESGPYAKANDFYVIYYAKGVGMIYTGGKISTFQQIRNWTVY